MAGINQIGPFFLLNFFSTFFGQFRIQSFLAYGPLGPRF